MSPARVTRMPQRGRSSSGGGGDYQAGLAGYKEVPERLADLLERYPDASLEAEVIRWPEDGFPFIVMEAKCFRHPGDPRPGIGWAQERYPGTTAYTRDSELQNCETSAWGRAIVAALASSSRTVASAHDVRLRTEAPDTDPSGTPGPPGASGDPADGQGAAEPEGEGPPHPSPERDPLATSGPYKGYRFGRIARNPAGREWLVHQAAEDADLPKDIRELALAWAVWGEAGPDVEGDPT